MRRPVPSRLVLTLLVALLVLAAAPGSAATAPGSTGIVPRVQLVGDSLSWSVRDQFPADWRIRAQNGRALSESLPILERSRTRSTECVVIALGSNDVGHHRTRQQMVHDISEAARILAALDCVAWTTVKVDGVHPKYGTNWARYARMWNTLVRRQSPDIVIDWNALAPAHPEWFLGDGLHLTAAGRTAYRALIVDGVTELLSVLPTGAAEAA